MAGCRMKARRQLSWLQVGAITFCRIVNVVNVVHVGNTEPEGDKEGKKVDGDVVDDVEDDGEVLGDVFAEEIVEEVVGEVVEVVRGVLGEVFCIAVVVDIVGGVDVFAEEIVEEVVGEVVGEVVRGVLGEVFCIAVVVDVSEVDEDDGGTPDPAAAFDTPTQAFQFSISSVQSVVIDAPAISKIVVFWPFIMRQIVTVT
jgi:hypothetical protein